MKNILILVLLIITFMAVKSYAQAVEELTAIAAQPIVLYGKTASGALVPILIDETGTVQLS